MQKHRHITSVNRKRIRSFSIKIYPEKLVEIHLFIYLFWASGYIISALRKTVIYTFQKLFLTSICTLSSLSESNGNTTSVQTMEDSSEYKLVCLHSNKVKSYFNFFSNHCCYLIQQEELYNMLAQLRGRTFALLLPPLL